MPEATVPGVDLPTVAHQLWALLGRFCAGPHQRRVGAAALAVGLSPVSAWAPTQLDPDRPLAQKELAERLRCSPSTVVDPADRLEARGLVVRRTHPADRRVKVLVVTDEGRRVREDFIARVFAPPEPLRRLSRAEQHRLRDLLLELLGC